MSALGYQALVDRLVNDDPAQQIIITPLLHAEQVGLAAIDLRMGNLVLLVKSRGLSHVNPLNYAKPTKSPNNNHFELARNKQQKFERYEVPFGQSFLLHPGTLALVPTLEWVRLPADVMGVVTARSSWAREGLNIATANFINPSYQGIVTLELANFGEIPIRIYPGLRLCQIAFQQLCGHATETKKSQFDSTFEPSGGNLFDPSLDPKLDHKAF